MTEQEPIINQPKRKRRWFWLLASPFLLFLFLCVLLYLPPIQRWVVDKATSMAAESTGLDVGIGHISLGFPLDLVVDEVHAVTREEGDTLLALDRMKVRVQFWPLLKKEVEIDEISLKGGTVDSRDWLEGMHLKGRLGELFLESHGVVFDPGTAVINEFTIKDTDLSLVLGEWSETDTTTTEPLYWKFILQDIDLENVKLALQMPEDSLFVEAQMKNASLRDGLVDLHQSAYSVQSFEIEEGAVAYDLGKPLAQWAKDKQQLGLDPLHMGLESIDLRLDSLYYCGRDIRAKVTRFDWKERSGIELVSTQGEIHTDAKVIRIPSWEMKTTDSSLDLKTEIAWEVLEMKSSGLVSAHLEAELGKQDMAKVLGGRDSLFVQTYPNQPLRIRTEADGNLNRLELKTLSAQLPGAFELNAEGRLLHLTDTLKRGGEFQLKAEAHRMDFLQTITDGSLALPQGTTLEGSFTLAGPKMGTDLLLKQPDAQAVTLVDSTRLTVHNDTLSLSKDFQMKRAARIYAQYDLSKDAYWADLVVNDLDVHCFMPKDSLFDVSLNLHADGEGLDFFAPETRFNVVGKVDKLYYTVYRLAGYDLTATLEQHQLDAMLNARNSAMELGARLDGKLKPNDVAAHLTVDVAKLDWQAMKLSEIALQSAHQLNVSFVSDLQQKYVVDASMTETSVKFPKKTLRPKDLFLGFSTSSDSTKAYMKAGDLDVDFDAKGYMDQLMQQVDVLTTRMGEQWKSKTIVQEELKTLLPGMSFRAKSGADNPVSNYLSHFLGIDYNRFSMNLDTSPQAGVNGEMFVYNLHTDSLTLDTVYVDLKHGDDALDFLTGVSSGPKKNQEAFDISLDGFVGNGKAQVLLQYLNARKEKGIYLGLNAELRRRGIRMKLFPEKPTLVYRPFELNERNYIYLTDKGRFYGNVRLYDEQGTGIHFYTNREDTVADQEMTVELAKINLQEFRRILPYLPQMDGWLGGEAHYVDSHGQMMVSGDLRMDDFVYEGSPLGSWELGGVYLPGDDFDHHVDGYVRRNGKEITSMNGIYRADDRGNEDLTGDLELYEFPLEVLNPFIPDNMVEFVGTLAGTLSMEGTPMKPKLNGALTMDSVFMAMPDLSVKFRFDDKQVKMADSRMVFDRFNIYTQGDTPFAINGSVDFSDMEKMYVDLRMKTDDYELMNAKKTRNATMYGKIYVDVDATLRGPVEELAMRGNMNVLGKTDFTYLLKDSPLAVNDRLGDMVTFVNFNDTVTVEPIKPSVSLTGMDIVMTIHIDQAVQARVDLTSDGSNYMLLEGGGDLAFQYTPQGEMLLNGRYTLLNGEMKYEIPVIPLKTFTIQNGSYMNWTGNVLNPEMNIKATERVRASVGSSGSTPRMVSFDVGVALTQRLEDLGLAFTLEAPEDGEVQEQLNAMGAEERGKLAITMLVTGMYMAEGNATGGFNVNNALNSYLQNQISNIAGQTLDISLGMESVDDTEGNKRTDYNFQFAKRFWNNRFRIVIGGTVSTGNAAKKEDTFIDNVAIEYRLDDSGTRYIKLFHDKNYESVLEGEVIETGVGVVLRKKVSRLGELFIFKKKKDDENEE